MIQIFSGIVPARLLTLFLSESVLIFGCYLAAAYWDPDLEDAGIFLLYDAGLVRITVVACLILLGLYFKDLYSQLRIRSRLFLLQELCMIFGFAMIGEGLASYINRDWTIPRRIMLLGSVLALAGLFIWRLVFDIAAKDALEPRRVLFLGLSPTALQLAGYFQLHPEFGFAPIGYLGSDYATGMDGSPSMPRLGGVADLRRVIDSTQPGSVVIGRREDIKPWWTNDFLELRFGGVEAEQAATLYEKTFGRVCAAEIWPSKLIFGGTWRVESVAVRIQTMYSILMAFVLLLFAAPVMLLIAALVKASSKGPVLVSERRAGLSQVPFNMYRFRCTYDAASSGSYTPLGRFLRTFSLDTLPELLNVLAGNMAMVGPQADRPEFAKKLSEEIPYYRQRYQVKPGFTGWAEVHFDASGSELDVIRRLEYDLYYVKKLSPALDSFVLMLSVRTILLRIRTRRLSIPRV